MGTSTVIRPACLKTNTNGSAAPAVKGATRPISITWSPPGFKAALPPAGTLISATWRIRMMPLSWIWVCNSGRLAAVVSTATRKSSSLPWFITVKNAAPFFAWPAVARANASTTTSMLSPAPTDGPVRRLPTVTEKAKKNFKNNRMACSYKGS